MNRHPEWFKGDEVAEKLNKWLSFLMKGMALPGLHTTITQTPLGRSINAKAGGRSSGVTYPFDLMINGTDVEIRPGTINGLLPVNMFTVFSVPATGVYHVKLECDTNDRALTQATIAIDGTPADAPSANQDTPPTTFEVEIGVIVDGVGYNIARAAIGYIIRSAGTSPNTGATAGEPLFYHWWTWAPN